MQWNPETVLTAGDLPLSQQVSLALDSAGVLHLTFADEIRISGSSINGVVKYVRGTPLELAAGNPADTSSSTG